MSTEIASYHSLVCESVVVCDDDRASNWELKERLAGQSLWARWARAAVVVHAANDQALTIEGEPGTGKEFVARVIHELSARREGPFVSVTCDSIAVESLAEALFGSMRRLPSGRLRVRRGLIERAAGGTLYLAGASTLPPLLKMELARLIEHQEFRRPGDGLLETADVRLIFGDTQCAPTPGEDERLAWRARNTVGNFSIPSLRNRKEDIRPLSRLFIKETCELLGKEPRELMPETLALLRRHHWPGNVGELKQVIESMLQQSEPPRLDPSLLPDYLTRPATMLGEQTLPDNGFSLHDEMKQIERGLLCAALKQSHGLQRRAAELLGLKPTTLNAKLKEAGIDAASFQIAKPRPRKIEQP